MSIDNKKSGWVFSMIFLFVAFLVLTVFYVVEINSVTTKSYEVESYNNRLESLRAENQRLFIEKTKISSFDSMKEKLMVMDFLELDNVEHLNVFEPTVALGE